MERHRTLKLGSSLLLLAAGFPTAVVALVKPIPALRRPHTVCGWQSHAIANSARASVGRTRLSMDSSGYVRQDESTAALNATPKTKRLYPSVGDIVRFYDLDGGQSKGQVLVGRISYIQKNLGNEKSGWSVELTELDDVGSGYFADYPYQQRRSKKTMRDLALVSPISASFVRAEDAFKVPLEADGRTPRVRAEAYDIDDYLGPFAGGTSINQSVVAADAIAYDAIKTKLLRYTALAGLVGTIVANLVQGTEDAVIYAAGATASLVYLFFLTVKTDTVASPDAKLGKSVANVRFLAPLFVLVGIALYNKSRGDDSPVVDTGLFTSVTAEQFGAAILGFLTYRIPLFLTQIQEAFQSEEGGTTVLPGSVGVAMQLATKSGTPAVETKLDLASQVATVLLVSGPQGTGRSQLVQRFIAEGQGRYVSVGMVDRVQDAVKFERLARRDEFLSIDATERYGMTKDAVLAATRQCGPDAVVVIDADVALAQKLTKVGGLRLVGVWVTLNSVAEFERRLDALVDNGSIPIPDGEDRASVIRARVREIVQEIEFGISSGIFEFTVSNQDEDDSLQQLREAAGYCFK